MRFKCWNAKATDTHSECVIPFASFNATVFLRTLLNVTLHVHRQLCGENQLARNFSACYAFWIYVAMFLSAHRWLISWARLIPSKPPHSNSMNNRNVILPSLLSIPCRLFQCGFHTKTMPAFVLHPAWPIRLTRRVPPVRFMLTPSVGQCK